MNELQILKNEQLIPLKENENGEVIIDGRELHDFLKVQQDFSHWIKNQLELTDSEEGKTHSLLKTSANNGGGTKIDYILTLDIAKEICMIAGVAPRTNEETKKLSKQARQYFIQIEKAWNSPEMIMKRALEIANKQVEKLSLENAQKTQIINELQPKASYYDLILQNNSLVAISVIAKDYGMGAKTLNKKLHELGVQYLQSNTWLLYAKYQDKGYTFSKTQNYVRTDGSQGSKMHTYWTQKGRLFIYDLLKEKGILPIIEREDE